jgi:hypothetical protein
MVALKMNKARRKNRAGLALRLVLLTGIELVTY